MDCPLNISTNVSQRLRLFRVGCIPRFDGVSAKHCAEAKVSADAGEELDNIHRTVPVIIIHKCQRAQLSGIGRPKMSFVVLKNICEILLQADNVLGYLISVQSWSLEAFAARVTYPTCSSSWKCQHVNSVRFFKSILKWEAKINSKQQILEVR